jgi:O-6-methylguanine DNA methyltransferase
MTSKPTVCVAIEPDLIAAATGEAAPPATERVQEHVAVCRACRDEFAHYRAIEGAVGTLRATLPPPDDAQVARERLLARLGDLRSRMVTYGVFPSPMGPILMGRTEHGVSIVEYLEREDTRASRKLRQAGLDTRHAATELEPFHRELLEFLAGRRTRLDWPLDMRLARSDFERAVLEATAAVPYGAVSSYTGIARDIGKPGSVRAVAQALRHNPVPIVVPCHRIVGLHGDLVGYAGHRTSLKEHLLTLEGVPTDAVRIARAAMYHYDPNPDRQYCVPTCGDIVRRPLGQVRLFGRRELAEAAGLSPCLDCRPDLHPLVS